MECNSHKKRVPKDSRFTEKQPLADDHAENADVAGIPHAPEGPSGYQALGRRDRSGRASTLRHKTAQETEEERKGSEKQGGAYPTGKH